MNSDNKYMQTDQLRLFALGLATDAGSIVRIQEVIDLD